MKLKFFRPTRFGTSLMCPLIKHLQKLVTPFERYKAPLITKGYKIERIYVLTSSKINYYWTHFNFSCNKIIVVIKEITKLLKLIKLFKSY